VAGRAVFIDDWRNVAGECDGPKRTSAYTYEYRDLAERKQPFNVLLTTTSALKAIPCKP
jgi:hypothetical protein